MNNNFVNILNIKISTLSKVDILNYINIKLDTAEKTFIATPNPEIILEANEREKLRYILNNQTDINIPDGRGILTASKILKTEPRIKTRIAGSDLTSDIIEIAKNKNKKIFLLGGNSIDQLKKIQSKINSDKILVDDNSYSLGFIKEDWDNNYNYDISKNNSLIEKINNSEAEIILVAFGAPKQEFWIAENLSKLNNIKLAIGIGGTFDFLSGDKKRAPAWMRKIGLEWLFRLIQEPSRIRRIINAVIVFPIKVIKSKK